MLTELAEADAVGEIAGIFAEIRHLYATPYVSSIHRHLATRPGVLEWAWGSVAPVFRTGRAQEMAWKAAADVRLPALRKIPKEALAVWGVAHGDLATLKAVAMSFTRVSPVNLVFGGLIADVLLGQTAAGSREVTGNAADNTAVQSAWVPPAAPKPPPAMVDPAKVGEAQRQLLGLFRSGTGDTAFVPGLYRMLAHWPGLLAHFAVELGPLFDSSEKRAAAEKILAQTRSIVADLAPMVSAKRDRPPPTSEEADHLRRMINGYRVTSPEMILFGRLIEEALPEA